MLKIFKSTSVRGASTVQDTMNDLATRWNWKNIVYDDDSHTNVKELWGSDKIYLSMSDDNIPKIKVSNSVNGYSQTYSSDMTTYQIIQTEHSVFVSSLSGGTAFICVAKTLDLDRVESTGIIINPAPGTSAVYHFTDNMTAGNKSYSTSLSFVSTSAFNTQLIPIYSVVGNEHFQGVHYALLKKSTDGGEVKLNEKYYYIYDVIALEYTPQEE